MPTHAERRDALSRLDEFWDRLREKHTELFVDPSSGEPCLFIPDDPSRGYYPTASKRVKRLIEGGWVLQFGILATSADVRNVISRLDYVAYGLGARLPPAVRQARLGDDPVFAAINAWVPQAPGSARIEPSDAVYQELSKLARHHPNKKAFPATESLQERIRVLDENRMLACVGIAYEVRYLAAVTLLSFTRMLATDLGAEVDHSLTTGSEEDDQPRLDTQPSTEDALSG